MGSAKKLVKAVAIGALIVVAAPVVGAALVGGTVTVATATAVGAGVITGGITAIQGGSPSDVLKSAVIGGVAAGLGAGAAGEVSKSVATAAAEAGYTDIAASMAKVAAGATQGGVSAASRSVLTGRGDPLEALLQGGISGGIAGGVAEGVNTLASDIPGFAKYDNATGKFTEQGDVPLAIQRATKAALATGALGGDMTTAAQNSMLQTVSKYASDQIKDYGNDLKASYQTAQSASKAVEENQAAQQKAIDDYKAKADEVNAKYEAVTAKTKEFEDAKIAWEKSTAAVEEKNKLAETANKLAGEANALIQDYNTYRPEADKELATYKDTLTTLQGDITKLDEAALAANKDLTTAVDTFQQGEAKNAAQLAQMVKDAETAQTVAKNELGIELTEEQLARAIQTGDIKGEASKIVAETNQGSIDLGYENYKDQTAAKTNGFEDAQQWAGYKDTSGIVDAGGDVNQVALGGRGVAAEVFEPEGGYDYGGDYSAGLPDSADSDYALSDSDMFPDDYVGATQDTTVADSAEPDALAPEDTTVADIAEPDMTGPETFMSEDTLTAYDDTPDINFDDLIGATPDVLAEDTTELPPDLQAQLDDLGLNIEDLGVDNIAALTQGPKIDEAMVAPQGGSYDLTSNQRLSDIGPSNVDAGLASLVSQQQGGTSASADDAGLKTITESNLGPDQAAGKDYGSAAFNALTGADTSRTITGNVLGQDRGDVLGGVGSGGEYTGKESEITPSDTLTNKYFSEAPQTSALAESISTTEDEKEGTTPEDNQPTASATDTVLQAGADQQPDSSFLPKVSAEEATLFKSKDASPTEAVTEGNNMADEYDITQEYTDLQVPPGAEPDQPQTPADFGEGWMRNLGEGSQEFETPDGKVVYYDDGRVETWGNDGRYVMYGADGSVVDYKNINDKNARVQTFAPDANGVPSGTYQGGKFTGPPQSMGDKIANAITGQLSNPKLLTALAGASLGAASKRTGITPKGLQSLQGLQGIGGGSGKTRVQTGAKGTGGKGSVRYFEKKAAGGEIGKGLGYLKGSHDGMADKIDATIDNKRPAKLSGGEFVIPADVVSHLGNGNSDAGAKQLYALMERVRKARTGNANQGKQINPKKYLPK